MTQSETSPPRPLGRSPASRRRSDSPYTSIAVRAHVEPPGWSPRRHRRRPTPGVALVVRSVPRDTPGEPSEFTLFALVAPTLGEMVSKDGFALPDPEPLVVGAAYPWDATAAEIRELKRVCEAPRSFSSAQSEGIHRTPNAGLLDRPGRPRRVSASSRDRAAAGPVGAGSTKTGARRNRDDTRLGSR